MIQSSTICKDLKLWVFFIISLHKDVYCEEYVYTVLAKIYPHAFLTFQTNIHLGI